MSDCRIGFYVHHHGQGHANRTREIARQLEAEVYLFGSDLSLFSAPQDERFVKVHLPSDVDERKAVKEDWPEALHYAPLGIKGIRERTHLLTRYFDQFNIDLLVVDVSVEIAMLARLCGVPTIYMRQHGYRTDAAHCMAFESASSLLAPYPADWDEPDMPAWVRQKTFYAGGFSRFSTHSLTKDEARTQLEMEEAKPYAVLMSGFGGSGDWYKKLKQTAEENSEWQWWVLGPVPASASAPSNLKFWGVQNDPYPFLRGADVVIAAAGNNTVMEVAQLQAHYICLAEERPFQEQHSKAKILQQKNAALVLDAWPEAEQWPYYLMRVMETDTEALGQIINEGAAQKAAQHILEQALSLKA